MDYTVKVEKDVQHERSNLPCVTPVMIYLKDLRDLRGFPETHVRDYILDVLRRGRFNEFSLNPEKYDLEKEETIVVNPNVKVASKTRQLGNTVFDGPVQLPDSFLKTWKRYKRRKTRGAYYG